MRNWRLFLAVLLATLATSGCAAVGLGLGNATPTGPITTRLVSSSFVDARRGWVVAAECPTDAASNASTACRTLVFQTIDGGRSWNRIARFLLSPRTVQFVDQKTGWLVGSIGERCGSNLCPNVVMLSQDGGTSWNRVSMVSAALTDGAAASASDDWAVGQNCRSGNTCSAVIARTTTAGQLWDNADLKLRGSGVYVDRLDLRHGWIATTSEVPGQASSILATTDGGVTWTVNPAPCLGGTNGLNFTSPLAGWLFCSATGHSHAPLGVLYRTADGGLSWSQVAPVTADGVRGGVALLPAPTAAATASGGSLGGAPTAVRFTSATTGWLAGSEGVVLATADGGQSWRVALSTGESLNGLQFIDPEHGWLLGTSSIWQTSDGGRTWNKSSPVPTLA